ncbi:MAG: IclR family transcriptional regulator [Lachnospiraceae bacterium]
MAENGIQVIDRVFDILELLSQKEDGMGVTEIGRCLDLNKTTVHRIVNGIMKRGYVEKTERGQYRLGLKFIALCSHRINSIELTAEARPYLLALTNLYGQRTHLAILDENEAVYLDKVEIERNLRMYSEIGKRVPVYCSALGKALLFDKSAMEIRAILESAPYQKKTPKTQNDTDKLIQEIFQFAQRGWSVDDEENEEEIRCIAAPIRDYSGRIIAAISVSGPIVAITNERTEEIAVRVMESAREISHRIGYWKE